MKTSKVWKSAAAVVMATTLAGCGLTTPLTTQAAAETRASFKKPTTKATAAAAAGKSLPTGFRPGPGSQLGEPAAGGAAVTTRAGEGKPPAAGTAVLKGNAGAGTVLANEAIPGDSSGHPAFDAAVTPSAVAATLEARSGLDALLDTAAPTANGVEIVAAPTRALRAFPFWVTVLPAGAGGDEQAADEAIPADDEAGADANAFDEVEGDADGDADGDAEGRVTAMAYDLAEEDPDVVMPGETPASTGPKALDDVMFAPEDGLLTWKLRAPEAGLRIAKIRFEVTGGATPFVGECTPAMLELPTELRGEMDLALPFATIDMLKGLGGAYGIRQLHAAYMFIGEDGQPIVAADGAPLVLGTQIDVL